MANNVYLPPSPTTPPFLLISAVTNAPMMVVTVTTPNSYVIGQKAYFSIPFDYGMFQLNSLTGQIVAIDVTNLILTFNIDSSQFDTFVIPASGEQPASLSSAGSSNIYNTLMVPFQSVNGGVGN